MLHTLASISEVLAFGQSRGLNYNLFDSRTFESNWNLEETFDYIRDTFVRLYFNQINPFIRDILNEEKFYTKNNIPVFTLDEGIFMKYLDLNIGKVLEYQIGIGPIRIFAFEDWDNTVIDVVPYMVLYSSAYNSIKETHNKYVSLFLNKKAIKANCANGSTDALLVDMISALMFSTIDVMLTKYNVPVNNVVNPTYTYESIILNENYTVSDASFIYFYYRTAFEIIISIFDPNKLKRFEDLTKYISLPDLFYCNSDIPNVYEEIFDVARKRAVHSKTEDDDKVVSICSDIYSYLVPYIDMDYASFTPDFENEDEESAEEVDYYEVEDEEDTNAES